MLARCMLSPSPERDRVEALAAEKSNEFNRSRVKISNQSKWINFRKMFDLLQFFKLYQAGRFTEALHVCCCSVLFFFWATFLNISLDNE